MEEKIPLPPKPSLPREAPWREIEEIIGLLRAIIAALTGKPVVLPPPTIIIPTPPVGVPPPASPPTEGQEPITSRLDIASYKLDVVAYKLDVVASLIPTLPTLEPVTTRLDEISGKLDTLISLYRAPTVAAAAPAPAPPDLTSVISKLDTIIASMTNRAAITTGQKNVTTAGKPEQLDDVMVPNGCKLTIIAKTGNSGYIYLGTKATAGLSNKRFDGLSAGLAVSLKVKNANVIWIDSSVSGEGVAYMVEQDK